MRSQSNRCSNLRLDINTSSSLAPTSSSIPAALYGSFEFSYAVNWEYHETDVTVEYNSAAGVTASSGVLTSNQRFYYADYEDGGVFYPSAIEADWTFRVSGDQLPPPGRYRVEFEVKEVVGVSNLMCVSRRNDHPLAVTQTDYDESITTTYKWLPITDITPWGGYNTDQWGPAALPVLADDTYEFAFWEFAFSGDPTPNDYQIRGMRWYCMERGGTPGEEIPLIDVPEWPAGATGFDDIPDLRGLSATPTDHPVFIIDFVVLDNDDVYLMWNGWVTTLGGPHRAHLVRWDGASWTYITNDPFGEGGSGTYTTGGDEDSIVQWSMGTDGTDVYLVYGRSDDLHASGYWNHKVHVRRYDTGSTTWSELGTGVQPLAPDVMASVPCSYNMGMPRINISPGGVPWICFASNNPSTEDSDDWAEKAWVYFWNGSAWVDAELPQPVNPHTNAPAEYTLDIAVIQAFPQPALEMTFATHAGPGENPSVVYNVWYEAESVPGPDHDIDKWEGEWVYHEYGGAPGSWSTLNFRFADYYPPGDAFHYASNFPDQEVMNQGMFLEHGNSTPILVAALWTGGIGILKMGAGGDWEPYPLWGTS